MENIYDIRQENKLLYILDDVDIKKDELHIRTHTVAVVINLYYEDTVEQYMKYLNPIPAEVAVYIISSKQEVLDKVDALRTRNISLLKKENRGRDISALLVAFRDYFYKYKYVCFLHDKKANHKRLEEDVDLWIWNLWGNTIGSSAYIRSVLQLFDEHENIGLLVPPEPMGDYLFAWYGDAWNGNFNNTVELARKLELKCNLEEGKQPLTIGTVFWARTECLQKLYSKAWCYEDFPSEPMPMDGTISHAIERVLGYVAQDAHYDVGTIMSNEYAQKTLLYAQDRIRKMYQLLDKKLGIHSLYQLGIYEEQEQRINAFCKQYEKIYLYGAGTYGKCILQMLKNLGYIPSGFVVGDGRKKEQLIQGLQVYEVGELEQNDKMGIIISVDFPLQDEIESVLMSKGITNYLKALF